MRKAWFLVAGFLGACTMQAQPPRSPALSEWWRGPISQNLGLSDAQTKQLNDIRQAYAGTLRDLNEAVTKAEGNLNEIYNQDKIDELRAGVAVDQYVNARDSLTRVLVQMNLKMRGVLTSDQWKQLVDLQAGRPLRGRGRGRGGQPAGSPQGSQPSAPPNKVGPALSQK